MNDDVELLERIRKGSPDDFTEIIRRHQPQVFAILHRYERDFHKVEDLAQETFVKAWRFLDRFDGRAPFHHWLSRIALRVALDHLRRQKRVRSEMALADLGESALEWLRDPDESMQLGAQQASELLDTALRELSPKDRLVITLLELEGRSIKEICALTGFASVNVRVRAYRTRARLKKILISLENKTHE